MFYIQVRHLSEPSERLVVHAKIHGMQKMHFHTNVILKCILSTSTEMKRSFYVIRHGPRDLSFLAAKVL